jgi:hypothetical protein
MLMLLLPALPFRLLVRKLCMLSCAFAATFSSPVSCSENSTQGPSRCWKLAVLVLRSAEQLLLLLAVRVRQQPDVLLSARGLEPDVDDEELVEIAMVQPSVSD